MLGEIHYRAVNKTAATLEKELSRHKELAKLVDRLVSNVKPDTIFFRVGLISVLFDPGSFLEFPGV